MGMEVTDTEHHLKSLLIPLSFDKESLLDPAGLLVGMFKRMFVISTAQLKPWVNGFVERIASTTRRREAIHRNIMTLGIDIALTLADIAVPPPFGHLAQLLAAKARIAFETRKSRLRTRLARVAFSAPEDALELLVRLIRYSLNPSSRRWRQLEDFLQRLASDDELFGVLAEYLLTVNYSAVIMLFDNSEKLDEADGVRDLLKHIYRGMDAGGTPLNLFFVFAAVSHSKLSRKVHEDKGFSDRFIYRIVRLEKPRVHPTPGVDDDFSRKRDYVLRKVRLFPDAPPPSTDKEAEYELRKQLSLMSRAGTLTWRKLWQEVCEQYDP